MNQLKRGFTLIELLVVVAVIATLAILVAPPFKRMIDMQRLRSINAALVTDLQFARAEAASRNQFVRVRFDDTGGSVTCYVILTGDVNACDCRNQPGVNVCTGATREIKTVQVDRSLNITAAVPAAQLERRIAFDPATGRMLVATLDVFVPPTGPFYVEVKNESIGGFRNELLATGRPSVCSPGGAISGTVACP